MAHLLNYNTGVLRGTHKGNARQEGSDRRLKVQVSRVKGEGNKRSRSERSKKSNETVRRQSTLNYKVGKTVCYTLLLHNLNSSSSE